jgi:hypothetical protein
MRKAEIRSMLRQIETIIARVERDKFPALALLLSMARLELLLIETGDREAASEELLANLRQAYAYKR